MAQASYRSKYHLLDEARCPIVSTVTRRPLGLAALHSRKTAMQAFSNHRTSCISTASQDRSDREWKSMEPIIELSHNDRSSCAQKVSIALSEKNLPWQRHHHNLRKGQQ